MGGRSSDVGGRRQSILDRWKSELAAWQALLDEAERENLFVQSFKVTVRFHQVRLDVFAEQEHALTVEQGGARLALRGALDEFVTASPNSVRRLLSVAYEDESALIEAAMPERSLAVPSVIKRENLELVGEAARLRRAPRL